jgi:hypothetical protein
LAECSSIIRFPTPVRASPSAVSMSTTFFDASSTGTS